MKSPRHFYEVISEDSVCHLYYDLEFKLALNTTVEPLNLLETFIQYICCQLKFVYNTSCDRTCILDLDSSNDEKFSRHLIIHLNKAAFRNNIAMGQFICYHCDRLRALRDMKSKDDYKTTLHPRSGRQMFHICQCPSARSLLQLFINTDRGNGLICDEGVYTKNRNFRLFLSTKKNKNTKLSIAKQNRYKSSHAVDDTKRKWSILFNILMDSLVCNVSYDHCAKILDPPFAKNIKLSKPDHSTSTTVQATGQYCQTEPLGSSPTQLEEGYCVSPYPSVDHFITSQLVRGGQFGTIRRWTYFSQGKLIVYDIQNYRWCENIGRAHKSNNIMIIADIKNSVYYQKCHDPECKRMNYRSNEYPIPTEFNPVFCSVNDGLCISPTPEGSTLYLRGNEEKVAQKEREKEEDISKELLHDLCVEDIFGDNNELVDERDEGISQDLLHDLSMEDIFGDVELSEIDSLKHPEGSYNPETND